MIDLTTIILTKNEEKNIAECISSILTISKRIIVIDSFSDDKTVEIAKSMGAEVYQNKFINHSKQFKYGLSNTQINTKWVFRIDADERISKAAATEIEEICTTNMDTDINGIIVRFEVTFMGKKLRHGGIYPFKKLLIFKHDLGDIEDRNMDEHIILLKGKTIELKNDSYHLDYKDLTYWISKHNWYASKEAIDYFDNLRDMDNTLSGLDKTAKVKRMIKYKIYYKLPIGLRAHLYFIYRYYIKLGFLDGKEGLIFNFLQAYWYRFLVDSKIYECRLNGYLYNEIGELKINETSTSNNKNNN